MPGGTRSTWPKPPGRSPPARMKTARQHRVPLPTPRCRTVDRSAAVSGPQRAGVPISHRTATIRRDSVQTTARTQHPRRTPRIPLQLQGLGSGANRHTPPNLRTRTRPHQQRPSRSRLPTKRPLRPTPPTHATLGPTTYTANRGGPLTVDRWRRTRTLIPPAPGKRPGWAALGLSWSGSLRTFPCGHHLGFSSSLTSSVTASPVSNSAIRRRAALSSSASPKK